MSSASTRPISRQAADAARLLGVQIAQGRRERGWPARELADRAGISLTTLRKAERGDASVRLGVALELAVLVGVDLFDMSGDRLASELRRSNDRLALLPQRIRKPERRVRDDF